VPKTNGKYDPAEFIIPGSDSKGNNERLSCRVIPSTHRAIELILGGKKFPFRTAGDVVRWCIQTGVARLEAMEGVNSVTAQTDAMMVVLRDEQFQKDYVAIFNNLQRSVDTHTQDNAMAEARRIVSQMRGHIERMPEGHWRDKYLKELDQRFGQLMRSAPKLGLGPRALRPDPVTKRKTAAETNAEIRAKRSTK
jgi:hypothetical protein